MMGEETSAYSNSAGFVLSDDYASRFSTNKVVQAYCCTGGIRYSPIWNSNNNISTAIIIKLSDLVLTNKLSHVYVAATRYSLWPKGPRYLVASDYGTPSQGTLIAADAAAFAEGKKLLITPGIYPIFSDVNLTSNIKMMQGAVLARSGGTHLTFEGFFEGPGLVQCFNDNTIKQDWVVFKAGAVLWDSPAWFGNVAQGSDDTNAINAAISALPPGAACLGGGQNYIVSMLRLKSHMQLLDFNLNTLTPGTDLQAPVTLDGTNSAKTNIRIERVYINGNRANMTGVGTSGHEDGGRSGFRIVGQVSNLTMRDISASYCACDGLEIFSNGVTSDDNSPAFQNIIIENASFTWNRRHGISGDSIITMTLRHIRSNNNGKDLNKTDAYTVGTRGARSDGTLNGNLYGRPFDLEGYGIGSIIQDIHINDFVGIDNVSGANFQDNADPTAANFLPRKDIFISNSRFNRGLANYYADSSLNIYAPFGTPAHPVYKNVRLDNVVLDEFYTIKGVDGFYYNSGYIAGKISFYASGVNYQGAIGNSKNWIVNAHSRYANQYID